MTFIRYVTQNKKNLNPAFEVFLRFYKPKNLGFLKSNSTALAGFLGWPFPMLKYKCIFSNKIYGSIFCRTALESCYGLQLPKC